MRLFEGSADDNIGRGYIDRNRDSDSKERETYIQREREADKKRQREMLKPNLRQREIQRDR
jgi:hypothetical protein